jgi:7,8-dihydroneopterin aldolase/epimerase/oxygenase
MGKISIEGMEFFAYHGCFSEEQVIGTRFQVDMNIITNTEKAEISDNISDTVNYQTIYILIKDKMLEKSHLLEHLARKIIHTLKEHFPQIEKIDVKVSKLNPALSFGGKIEKVSVTLSA